MKSLDKEPSIGQLLKQLKAVEAKINKLKKKQVTASKASNKKPSKAKVVKKRTLSKCATQKKKRCDISVKSNLRFKAASKAKDAKMASDKVKRHPKNNNAGLVAKSGGKSAGKSSVKLASAKRPDVATGNVKGEGKRNTLTIRQYDKRLNDGRLNVHPKMPIRVFKSHADRLKQKAKESPKEQEFRWYVISVNTNFSDRKVRRTLTKEKKIAGLEKLIKNVKLLRYESHETRNGMPMTFHRARFPGYLFVQCKMTPEVQTFIQTHKGVFCILMNPNNLQSADSLHMAQLLIEQSKSNQKKRIAQSNPLATAAKKQEIVEKQQESESEPVSKPPTSQTKFVVDENVIVNIPPNGPWHGMEGKVVRIDDGRYTVQIATKVLGNPLVINHEFPEHHLVSVVGQKS